MNKIISNSLSPNTERDDIVLALKVMFGQKRRENTKKLERVFRNYFGFKNAFAFNSGRSSLIAILKAMEIKEGDEVVIQAFTCNAAVNPIIYVGAKPVFADINKELNMDPNSLIQKINKKTKAVIIQHTFGNPGEINEIRDICKNNNIYLIEDCAHSLGAMYNGEFCGFFGDASFFSFGRDKVISSVYGGMVTVNNNKLIGKVSDFQKNIKNPSPFWTLQQLIHPILTNVFVLPIYNMKIGRALMAGLINFNILSKAVTRNENQGNLPNYFPKKMPDSLSALAIHQLKKLERYNKHRIDIANYYNLLFSKPLIKKEKENIYLKYPIIINNPSKILSELRKYNIYLNDGWSGSPIMPKLTSLEKVCYSLGSCPKAEEVANKIISLPTHINISKKDAKLIFDSLEKLRQNK
ncbi:MAG: aminotransferase class V-fold PLP-dependent enzyme [Candidatus Pacebacteria bacterium]|nr:aminotransferase class V-fold PLP-dependent enzyme [Candidatus Paceibacterota bacterium]MDD4074198.1 aminotransferase class V-fold PLP-dependent enzyme [Candidatus Paceibacterota bacterium]